MKKQKHIGLSLTGFLSFFAIIGAVTTGSVMVYNELVKINSSVLSISACLLGNVLFGTFICLVIDYWRRKIMVIRPTEKILEATQKIASGDFDVKLTPNHKLEKYDEYDKIMENINTMASELSKNEVLKTDFISNVSHEIKTPLAIIQNYATMLTSEHLDENKKKQYLETLISATKRLSNLISNILKLNKLENQNIAPETKEFDLSELVRTCILNFEEVIERKGLELECNISEVSIKSEQSYLEIAINNLISNAIKFTDSGKILVNLKQNAEKIIIEIKDTGCGMSQDVSKHIFDKFYQGDSSHSKEGNGLGLALVKKIVDLLGGEIKVKSTLGKGSTFTIILKKE